VTDPKGFLQIQRRVTPYRPVEERLKDYAFVAPEAEVGLVREQARRCMGCGEYWHCYIATYRNYYASHQ
jgi:glutamate synthase (NADPH/NADH) small chain